MKDDDFPQTHPCRSGDSNLGLLCNQNSSSDEHNLYAYFVSYDESMKPKDIDWFKVTLNPNNLLLPNNAVSHAVVEAIFVAIFAPGQTFVWFNQNQVDQTARMATSLFCFALSRSAQKFLLLWKTPNP